MSRALLCTTLAIGIFCASCNEPERRLNAPPHGTAEETTDMQGTFAYMSDNALMADMTITDMHFMPHRALLTSTGEERMARLVGLMEAYGGTIRFNTDETDSALVDARTQTIMNFLTEAGVDTTKEVLRQDMAGGEGMPAAEAILIRAKEGTYTGQKSGNGGGARNGAAATGGGGGSR